jgi:hypothetical protein
MPSPLSSRPEDGAARHQQRLRGPAEGAPGCRRRLRQEDRGRPAVQGEGRTGAEEDRAEEHQRQDQGSDHRETEVVRRWTGRPEHGLPAYPDLRRLAAQMSRCDRSSVTSWAPDRLVCLVADHAHRSRRFNCSIHSRLCGARSRCSSAARRARASCHCLVTANDAVTEPLQS